jgi:membrane protein implicated in regulation of membrane protease activity
MSGGQIAAVVCAALLLLPGGCFLVVGVAVATDRSLYDIAWLPLLVAAVLLGVSVLLFWLGLRRRPQAPLPPPAAQA